MTSDMQMARDSHRRTGASMALSRSTLKAMGLEDDKVDSIIAMHSETVEALKGQRDAAQEEAGKVPALEKKVKELEEKQPTEDFEKRYNEEHEAFEAYKAKVEADASEREKAALYRALLVEQGIDGKRLDSIMKVTDLSGVSVKDGRLEDAEALGAKAAEEWADFVVQTATEGAKVDKPNRSAGAGMTRDEIMAIKDTGARQKAIAENIEQFR